MGLLDPLFGILQNFVDWFFKSFLTSPIQETVGIIFEFFIRLLIRTPHPDTANPFAQPSGSGVWNTIYDALYIGNQVDMAPVVPLSLFILTAAWMMVMVVGSFSAFLSSYDVSRVNRRAMLAGFAIMFWYPLYTSALQISHELAVTLAPDKTSFGGDNIVNLLSAIGGAIIIVLVASALMVTAIAGAVMVYVLRELLIYTYAIAMPIFFALWAIDIGFMKPVSNTVQGFMQYVTPIIMFTLPSAILLRVWLILNNASVGGFFFTLILPIAAIYLPKQLFDLPGQQGLQKAQRTATRFERQRARYKRKQGEGGGGGGGGGGRDEEDIMDDEEMEPEVEESDKDEQPGVSAGSSVNYTPKSRGRGASYGKFKQRMDMLKNSRAAGAMSTVGGIASNAARNSDKANALKSGVSRMGKGVDNLTGNRISGAASGLSNTASRASERWGGIKQKANDMSQEDWWTNDYEDVNEQFQIGDGEAVDPRAEWSANSNLESAPDDGMEEQEQLRDALQEQGLSEEEAAEYASNPEDINFEYARNDEEKEFLESQPDVEDGDNPTIATVDEDKAKAQRKFDRNAAKQKKRMEMEQLSEGQRSLVDGMDGASVADDGTLDLDDDMDFDRENEIIDTVLGGEDTIPNELGDLESEVQSQVLANEDVDSPDEVNARDYIPSDIDPNAVEENSNHEIARKAVDEQVNGTYYDEIHAEEYDPDDIETEEGKAADNLRAVDPDGEARMGAAMPEDERREALENIDTDQSDMWASVGETPEGTGAESVETGEADTGTAPDPDSETTTDTEDPTFDFDEDDVDLSDTPFGTESEESEDDVGE